MFLYIRALQFRDEGDRSFTRQEFSDLMRNTYRSMPKDIIVTARYWDELMSNEAWEEPIDPDSLEKEYGKPMEPKRDIGK